MKSILLALSISLSIVTFGQDSLKTKKDKPKEPKQEKPKEKKEKKERTFSLVGVEASTGNQYFQPTEFDGYASTKSGMYKGFIDKDSPFFTYFGDNANTYYTTNGVYSSSDRLWINTNKQTDFITTWAFGKKGKINPKHVIKMGFGYSHKYYAITQYNMMDYRQADTTGYTYIGTDTVAFIKDTSVFKSVSLTNYVSMGHVSLAYNYRLHSDEKLSLSFGAGIDVAMGSFSVSGTIDQYYRSNTYGQSITGNNWHYQNQADYSYKVSKLVDINEKRFKAATFRPYILARVDYRLSKKFPVLKHINLFAEGRFGKEFSNIGKKFNDNAPSYLGLRFGIAYNFFKGL